MHKKRNKKEYTLAEAQEKIKKHYEQNMKKLKFEHDQYVQSLRMDDIKEQLINFKDFSNLQNIELYDKLRKQYGDLEKIKTNSEYKTIAIMEAEKLWMLVKLSSMDENYQRATNEQKMELIEKDFAPLAKNFPIVVKYMVCLNLYNQNCFKRFLEMCDKKLTNAPLDRKKGYMEEEWIACQASYVKFLWENEQTKRYHKSDADKVYRIAYESIKAEFKEFRKLHEDMEKKVKTDETKHKISLLKEVSSRVINGEQTLDIENMRLLVENLKDKKYKQNYKRVLTELKETIDPILCNYSAYGTNEEARFEYSQELANFEAKKKLKKMPI